MALGIKIPKNTFSAGREKFAAGDDYGNVELDPGKYICQVVKGRGVDSAKGPQIVLDLVVAGETEKAGGKISVWYKLTDEHSVYLFRTLSLLGYEVADLDEAMLEEILNDIETNKPVVRVKATRKDEFMNYRIEKLLTDVTIADGVTENAADTEAAGGTAGIKEEAHGKAAVVEAKAAPAPKPLPAKKPVQATKVADPPPAAAEEVVADEEVVAEDEEAVPLKIGDKVNAALNSGPTTLVITAIHQAENKVTGRKPDGTLIKCGLEKLS